MFVEYGKNDTQANVPIDVKCIHVRVAVSATAANTVVNIWRAPLTRHSQRYFTGDQSRLQ